ncbi:unnamed protein product [Calicophoron daubneyi]|uniref:Uncharacterized protein n=1 Tax=Calicophoron daubneyi TaxID=300641 RepID=A0AAV2T568_CALDB
MGAGYSRVLNYLDVGPEKKEADLKKGKYARVLTSGEVPKKPSLLWKTLPLDRYDDAKTAASLKEGVDFIHSSRMSKQNTLVLVQPNDPDSVVFAAAYVMVLSGLPPETAYLAMENCMKESEIKLARTYINPLKLLRSKADPKTMRSDLFKTSGIEPNAELTEDMTKIYSYLGRPKPTQEQVNLDAIPVPEQKPVQAPKPEVVDKKPEGDTRFLPGLHPEPPPTAAAATKKEEPKRAEEVPSEPQKAEKKKLELKKPEPKGKMTPEQNVFVAQEVPMFEDTTLVPVAAEPKSHLDHFPLTADKPASHVHTSEPINAALKKIVSDSPHVPQGNESRLSADEEWELKKVKEQSQLKLNHEKLNGSTGQGKVQIIMALSKDPADDTREVDEYLAKTTAEERERHRPKITIIRAYEKLDAE